MISLKRKKSILMMILYFYNLTRGLQKIKPAGRAGLAG